MDHRLRQKGSSVPLTTFALAASLSTALAVSGCVTHEPEETGEIRVAITLVPADVQCIRIFADGSRFVNQKFPVTPGMSSVIQMHGIPTGHVNFTADAFAETCDNVHDNTSTPTWSSDPVAADITANMVTTLTLTMHHNGNVNIVIDFGDDGTMCAGLGQVCMPTPTGASACCAGLTCNTATAQPTCMIAQMCIPDGAMCLGATIPCCDGGPCNANAVCGQMCRPLNAACAAGPDCCTGACIMGLCQPPNACVPDGVPCIATQP